MTFVDEPIPEVEHAGRHFYAISPSALVGEGVPEAAVLPVVKDRIRTAIDAQAEALRARIITPGAGQALEYQEAQAQAAAALKAPSSATADKYPMLAATVGIDVDPETGKPATDILGVARSIQAARDAWLTIGSAIRGARLKAKAAIDVATTLKGAQAAYDAIEWPALPAG